MNNIKFDDYDLDIENFNKIDLECKYILDGATTLDEAMELVNGFMAYLQELESNGFELEDVIVQGKGRVTLDPIPSEDSLF